MNAVYIFKAQELYRGALMTLPSSGLRIGKAQMPQCRPVEKKQDKLPNPRRLASSLAAVQPWVSHLTSLSLRVFTYQVGIILSPLHVCFRNRETLIDGAYLQHLSFRGPST